MVDDSARFLDHFRSLITVPFVADPAKWPKADSARCCLFEAVNIAGQGIKGELWTGRELHARDWPISPNALAAMGSRSVSETGAKPPKFNLKFKPDRRFGSPPRPIISIERQQELWEENASAVVRLKGAVECLAQQCRDGAIKSYARMVHGGELHKMEPSEWFVDDPFSEFVMRGGNDRQFSAYSAPTAAYVFLDRLAIKRVYSPEDASEISTATIPREATCNAIAAQRLKAPFDDKRGDSPPNLLPARRSAGKYKGGNAERDAAILTKFHEIKQTQSDGRKVASLLPKEPGFDDVGVLYVRKLVEGRYKQGNGALINEP